jgi:hypothetical protein
MGVPIKSFEDYQSEFKKVAEAGSLYAFFLYSTAGDYQQIVDFIRNKRWYFDELAQHANTWLFYFDQEIAASPGANPSAMIARLFDISLAELPGVLVFAEIQEDEINDGVFFPFSRDEIIAQPQMVEQKLAHVFNELRKMQESTQDIIARMDQLRGEPKRLAAAERWRKIRNGMGAALSSMKDLPSVLVGSIGTALGEAAAKHAGL